MELELNVVAIGKADSFEHMLFGNLCDATMTVGQLNAIGAVFEDFDHGSPCPELVWVGHVRT